MLYEVITRLADLQGVVGTSLIGRIVDGCDNGIAAGVWTGGYRASRGPLRSSSSTWSNSGGSNSRICGCVG